MMIPINKDFEKEFKDEALGGYTMRECLWIGGIILFNAGTFLFFTFIVGISSNITVYFCIPVTLAIGFMGFKQFQDLTFFQWRKAVQKEKEHEILLWSAGEDISENAAFINRKLAELQEQQKESRKAENRQMKEEKKRSRQLRKKKNKDLKGDG